MAISPNTQMALKLLPCNLVATDSLINLNLLTIVNLDSKSIPTKTLLLHGFNMKTAQFGTRWMYISKLYLPVFSIVWLLSNDFWIEGEKSFRCLTGQKGPK